MEEVGGKTKTIQELLSNKKYELDYYQREYSWQTKHVTDLLQDLNSKFSDSYKEDDEPTDVPGYGHYFLGSIIITNAENRNFVIDGQQRLTTLTLLLIKLFHLLDNEDWKGQITPLIFSLKHGKKSFNLDIPDREQVMGFLYSGDPFEVNDQSESIRNIAERYNDIEDHFPEKLQGKALHCFVDWLLEKVCFVEITTKTDDDAYTIFETMNDRGLSLTPTDMLRGYLLSKISNKERRNKALKVWDGRITKLKELGRDGESNAIKAWLRSQYAQNMNDFDKIGSEFHRWVRENQNLLHLFSTNDFVKFIEQNFDFYCFWYERLQVVGKELKQRYEYVYYNAQNITFHYSFLLAPLHPDDSKEEIIRKIQIVATYLDILINRRIWNTLPVTQNLIADQMFPIIPVIRGKSSSELSDILYKQFDTDNQEKISGIEIPPFANNLLRLQGNNRRKIHLILARMTEYIEIQSGQSPRYPEYIKKTGKNNYEVEHIWANHFKQDTDEFSHELEFEEYRNRIGGLLLLPKKSNTSYGDSSYSEKYGHYIKENLLAQSLHQKAYENNPGFMQFIEKSGLPFRHHPEFMKKDLDARQKLYRLIAERIWNPERLKLPYGYEPDSIIIEDAEDKYETSGQDCRQKVWTKDQIRDLVPLERRDHYETKYKNKAVEFYRQVAKLYDLIQRTGWEQLLTLEFHQGFCAFYIGRSPVFGVNLYGPPRFFVRITEEEAIRLTNYCEHESYYLHQAIYPHYTKLDELYPIFEFAYKKFRGY